MKQWMKNKLTVYISLLTLLSTVLYFIISDDSKWISLLMFVPLICRVLTQVIFKEKWMIKGKTKTDKQHIIKFIFLSLSFPIVIGLISYGIPWISGLVTFHVPGMYLQLSPLLSFLFILITNALFGTIMGLPYSFGEEMGWRGYLLPKLIEAGVASPLLLNGVIWGLWHVPIILMGKYYPGPELISTLTFFMISATCMGYILCVVYLRSKSIWPCIILHAAWNAIIQNVFDVFSSDNNRILLIGESGLFVSMSLLLASYLLSRSKNTKSVLTAINGTKKVMNSG